jgi:Na+/H+-translocating membrane pyrophosphatase
MILPSILGLSLPVVTGLVLGVAGVLGLLVGTLTCGFCVAIFMANSGGAWDNAKKRIERVQGYQWSKLEHSHQADDDGERCGGWLGRPLQPGCDRRFLSPRRWPEQLYDKNAECFGTPRFFFARWFKK